MTSIVRIKRRLSQEPAEALLLASSSKKLKGDENQNVYKFCGTVANQDGDLEAISRLVAKSKSMAHRTTRESIRKKGKSQPVLSKSSSSEKKYKLLNSLRQIEASEAEASIKLYDLVCEDENEKQEEIVTCNGIPLVVESCAGPSKPEAYVYDFYYSDVGVIDESYIDKLMSVQPFSFSYETDESDECESEDSNAEDYWTNDYPDTEEDENPYDQDDEDRVLEDRLERFNLEDGEELSFEDEDLIYSVDNADDYHGTAYAAYKKRILKELSAAAPEESDSDDEISD